MVSEARRTPTEAYKSSLAKSIDTYAVRPRAYQGSSRTAIDNACTVLQHLRVDPVAFDEQDPQGPERGLFTLAVADQLTTPYLSPREELGLMYTLKRALTGYDLTTNKPKTYSGLVVELAKNRDPEGTDFDPQSVMKTERNAIRRKKARAQREADDALTDEVKAAANNWGADSELAHVRAVLKITPANDKPYDITVIRTNLLGMKQKFGNTAFCIGSSIYLCRESRTALQHEYGHAQSKSHNSHPDIVRFSLFQAIAEATTEENIQHPTVYSKQRDILRILRTTLPNFREDNIGTYMGEASTRRRLLSGIIDVYGFEGLLAVARQHARGDEKDKHYADHAMLLTKDKVQAVLKRRVQ